MSPSKSPTWSEQALEDCFLNKKKNALLSFFGKAHKCIPGQRKEIKQTKHKKKLLFLMYSFLSNLFLYLLLLLFRSW